LAEDIRLKRKVALKMLASELISNEEGWRTESVKARRGPISSARLRCGVLVSGCFFCMTAVHLIYSRPSPTMAILATVASTGTVVSEADGLIHNFTKLSPSQVQDLLNFLRSL